MRNGECIGCVSKCQSVPQHMQGFGFRLETFISNIKGVDVILGAQRLMQLRDVTMNYLNLTMEFMVGRVTVKLQGERLFQLDAIGSRTLNKMVSTDVIASFLHLKVLEPSEPTKEHHQKDESIQKLLEKLQEVF
ncbi:hypothetical protein S245_017753 [Arachis hypogaea]